VVTVPVTDGGCDVELVPPPQLASNITISSNPSKHGIEKLDLDIGLFISDLLPIILGFTGQC
jgi:hypothetical protein